MSRPEANPSFVRSLRGAWAGLVAAYRQEPNLRSHLAAAWLVLGLAWLAAFTPVEWTCLIILIGVVIFAELVNTAMERLGDREARGKPCLLVAEAKRVAAAAVLVAAVAALAGGALLFGPKLATVAARLGPAWREHPVPALLYLLALAALAGRALEARWRPKR